MTSLKKKKITTKDLSKSVQDAGFAIVGSLNSAKFVHPRFGLIDFRNMKVKQAEYLVANGFEHLKKGKNTDKEA